MLWHLILPKSSSRQGIAQTSCRRICRATSLSTQPTSRELPVLKGTPTPKILQCSQEGCPRYDAGVVVLKKPVRMAIYGDLPEAGLVDTLKEGQRLTAVGYGATRYKIGGGLRPRPVYPGNRNRAAVKLLNTKDSAVGEMFVKTTGVSLTGATEQVLPWGFGRAAVHAQPTDHSGRYLLWHSPLYRGPGLPEVVPRVLKWVRSFP